MNLPAAQLNHIDLKIQAIEEWEEDHLYCISQMARHDAETQLQHSSSRRLKTPNLINELTQEYEYRYLHDILAESGPNNENGYATLMSYRNKWIAFRRGEL